MLALAGGRPGALMAQQVLRHKSSKAQFRAVFWATVMVNVAGFAFLPARMAKLEKRWCALSFDSRGTSALTLRAGKAPMVGSRRAH